MLRHLDTGAEDVNGVLAALTTLLDEAHLRVGNQAYVKENGTYGATTLLKRHLKIVDGQIEMKFRAKGGKRVQRSLKHPQAAEDTGGDCRPARPPALRLEG